MELSGLTCQICYQLLQSAVTVPKCGHSFCESCIAHLPIAEPSTNRICITCQYRFNASDVVPNWAARKLVEEYINQNLNSGHSNDQEDTHDAHDAHVISTNSKVLEYGPQPMPDWYTPDDQDITIEVRVNPNAIRRGSTDGEFGNGGSSDYDATDGAEVHDDDDEYRDDHGQHTASISSPTSRSRIGRRTDATEHVQDSNTSDHISQYRSAVPSLFEWKITQPKAPLFTGPKALLHPQVYSDEAVQRRKRIPAPRSSNGSNQDEDAHRQISKPGVSHAPTRTSIMRQSDKHSTQSQNPELHDAVDPNEILGLGTHPKSIEELGDGRTARNSVRLVAKQRRAQRRDKLGRLGKGTAEDDEGEEELEGKLALLARHAGITETERAEIERLLEDEKRETELMLKEKLLSTSSMYALNPAGLPNTSLSSADSSISGSDSKRQFNIYDVSIGRKVDDRQLFPLHQVPDGPLHSQEYYAQKRSQDAFLDVKSGGIFSGLSSQGLKDVRGLEAALKSIQGISDEALIDTSTSAAGATSGVGSTTGIQLRPVSASQQAYAPGDSATPANGNAGLTGQTDIASFLRAIREDLHGHTATIGKGIAAKTSIPLHNPVDLSGGSGSSGHSNMNTTNQASLTGKSALPTRHVSAGGKRTTQATAAALSTLNSGFGLASAGGLNLNQPNLAGRRVSSASSGQPRPSSTSGVSASSGLPNRESTSSGPMDARRPRQSSVTSTTAQARRILEDPKIKTALVNPDTGLTGGERENIVRRVAGRAMLNNLSNQIQSSEQALRRMRGQSVALSWKR